MKMCMFLCFNVNFKHESTNIHVCILSRRFNFPSLYIITVLGIRKRTVPR